MPASAKSKSPAKSDAPAPAPHSRPLKAGDHLFLVDGSGYIFRAYHALPPLSRKSDGLQVNAVLGFCNMLWKLLADMKPEDKPTHLAVVFDKSEKTFRTDFYPEYKANRSAPPDDLIPQFALIREATRAFDLPCLEQGGFEADDLIATYARLACEAGATTTIVSSDKDLMQLVNDCVTLYDTMKDKRIGQAEVIEKFGVPPDKVIEVQALIGDSTDNVPGVPGIGVKTAAQLIAEYGDLETLLSRATEIKQQKRRETLIENADLARLSRRLVTLDQHVALDVAVDDLAVHAPDYSKLVSFLKAMEFSTLTKRIADIAKIDLASVSADPKLTSHEIAISSPVPTPFSDEEGETPRAKSQAAAPANGGVTQPSDLATARLAKLRAEPFDASRFVTVTTQAELQAWAARAIDAGLVAVTLEASSIDPMQATICGLSLALGPNDACYVPINHTGSSDDGSLFAAEPQRVEGQVTQQQALDTLRALFSDPGVLKVGHNIKPEILMLALRGIDVVSADDTMLMSYVLDAGRGAHGLGDLSQKVLGRELPASTTLTGTGKNALPFERVEIGKAAPYSATRADTILRLWRALKARMPAERVTTVYETLERPLVPVLARMERRGIAIDKPVLARLSNEFAQKQATVETEINTIAGTAVNPGSPKQLGDVLFGQMGLPGGTKTKTGQWATGARALEELAELGHELPRKILDWRQVSKLRSTYTDALPQYARGESDRVHTNYALAATSTGRLSSSEPNLQNIPVRTEEGRKIRKAFVATPG